MHTILFLAVLIPRFLWWDFLTRLHRAVRGHSSFLRFHREFMGWMARETGRITERFTGVRIHVDSALTRPLPERMIIVSNHQALADIPFLLAVFPDHDVRFLAKQELGYGVPLISASLRYGRHGLIPRRKGFSHARAVMLRLVRTPGVSPALFPEGTRSRDGTLGVFHTAGVRLMADESALPILAVALDGGWRLRSLKNFNRISERTNYRIRLLSLHPSPKTREATDSLLKTIKGEIQHQLDVWRQSKE